MIIWIVIPAYNGAVTIGDLLKEARKVCGNILVIDDGSTDETLSLAESMGCRVIHSERNQGKGHALRSGIAYLLDKESFDYIIFMDADGQHLVKDLGGFIAAAKANAEFVVGNRMNDHTAMPLIRVWTNKTMSKMISDMAKQKIPDSQCGFRMVRRDILKKMDLKMDRFEIESEMLVKASRLGARIDSIPVTCIYRPSIKSQISPLIDTVRFLRFIFDLKYREG